MCAFTEPVRTGIGAVCVEYGRPKWPITMLNHTYKHPWYRIMFVFFWHPMLVRPVMKRLLFPWKTKEQKARFARAPHYYTGTFVATANISTAVYDTYRSIHHCSCSTHSWTIINLDIGRNCCSVVCNVCACIIREYTIAVVIPLNPYI